MSAQTVTAPKGASPELREAAKQVNALARKIATREGTIGTANHRYHAIGQGRNINAIFGGPSKRDRRQMNSEYRKARTAGIDLQMLQQQHQMALVRYTMLLKREEGAQALAAAQEAAEDAIDEMLNHSASELNELAQRVAMGELNIINTTISNETVAQYGWSNADVVSLKTASENHSLAVVLGAAGEPPVMIKQEDVAAFKTLAQAALEQRRAAVTAPQWAPPSPAERRG